MVITVIQCSDFYEVGRDGKRKDLRDDSTSGSGNHSAREGNSTLLCTIVSPQTWKREQPCAQRREQFRNIWERFNALCQPTRTELYHQSADRWKKDESFKFFSHMFGLEYLRNYIGEITFARFLWMMETDPPSDILSVGAREEEGLPVAGNPTLHGLTHALKLCYLYCTGGTDVFWKSIINLKSMKWRAS
ncbi:hypothetical protein F5141DRAFT_235589 [Pisolithus sp. B1]|nr:hypothetical protein F5141DRAFT_235589 [Pisolithus sp. B1]